MIKKARMILVCGLAAALGVSALAYGVENTDNVSTVKLNVKSKAGNNKFPKRIFKQAKLTSGVTTLDADNNPEIPAEATEQVFIDYDDDIKIRLGGVPTCDKADLANTTTADANVACGSSRLSVAGSAKARIPSFPAPNQEVSDFTVTAFRGEDEGGKKVVLLHAYSPTLTEANTQVVVGTLGGSPSGGDYGTRLTVLDAPDVAGDNGALVAFESTLKKGNVITARCKDRNRRLNTKARFVYDDGTTDNAKAFSRCRVKR